MAERIAIYIESGAKRTFASAIDWPGWSRAGRTEDEAVAALLGYGRRYVDALGAAARSLRVPADAADLDVVERIKGGSGTDFGVPSLPTKGDARPIDDAELERLRERLEAAWSAFDRAAKKAAGKELRKGPRGGGRDLARIVEHVIGAEDAYVSQIRGAKASARFSDPARQWADVRERALAAFADRAHGVPPPESRHTSKPWLPRYYARRSAWHALDHAWEVEDRIV